MSRHWFPISSQYKALNEQRFAEVKNRNMDYQKVIFYNSNINSQSNETCVVLKPDRRIDAISCQKA
jgi:hypothetical protein